MDPRLLEAGEPVEEISLEEAVQIAKRVGGGSFAGLALPVECTAPRRMRSVIYL